MNIVKVRGLSIGEGEPKICIPITARSEREIEASLRSLEDADYDLVEFRADYYQGEDRKALRLVREAVGDKPILYTLRTRDEGGSFFLDAKEYERRSLASASYVDIVDIQLSCLGDGIILRKLNQSGVKVIGSYHNFSGTPDTPFIVKKLVSMQEKGFDITKIALMPSCRSDVLKLMSACVEMSEKRADRPFIAISMGGIGKVTRAACSFTGSAITFGTALSSSAPGQIPSTLLRTIMDILA